jgi:hypothetical protein
MYLGTQKLHVSTFSKNSVMSLLTSTDAQQSTMIPNPNHGWCCNTVTLFTSRAAIVAELEVGTVVLMFISHQDAEEIMQSWETGLVITNAVIW